MDSKVSSDWLPSYIKAKRPVLEIFKMAEYFQLRPHTFLSEAVERGRYGLPFHLTI
jgi:hypothetical protein